MKTFGVPSLPERVICDLDEYLLKKFDSSEYSFSIENGSKNGDSYSSYIFRVIVQKIKKKEENSTYSAAGSPIKFIVKLSPKSEIRRAVGNIMSLYSREYHMYSNVLPELEEFQKYHLQNGSNIFRSYPRMIRGCLIPMEEYIILEDLSVGEFKNFDRPVPLNFKQCTAVFKTLALLHATSFAFMDQHPEKFAKLVEPLDEVVFKCPISKELNIFLQNRIDPALNALQPDEKDVRNAMIRFRDVIGESMVQCVADKDHAAVLHGDCWISNLLHRQRDNSSDIEIAFIDWQVGRYATPVVDLAYFTFCCTDTELRAQLPELLRIYYETLSGRITDLGSDPKDLYGEKVFYSHVKKYMKFGLGMALMTLHSTSCDAKEMPDVIEVLNNANFETFNSLTDIMCKKDVYKKRMAEVCRDMVLYGYI